MKIVYRIVHIILAAAVFPAIYFLQLIYAEISPTFMDYGMKFEISLYNLFSQMGLKFETIKKLMTRDNISVFWEVFAPVKVKLMISIIFFCLAVLTAVFIIIAAIVKGNRKVLLTASAAGLVFTIVFMAFFASSAKALTTGQINIVGLFTSDWEGILGLIGMTLGSVISIDTLQLGGFANAILIIYICLTVWNVIYIATDYGLEQEGAKQPAPAKKKKKKK